MKHTSRIAQPTLLPPGIKEKKRNSRHAMHRYLRRFLILILIVIIAAVLLSGYASLFPVHFTAPVPVFPARDSQIDYEVLLEPNAFTDQDTLGMDQRYLLDLTRGVDAVFAHQITISRAIRLHWQYQVDAVLEARAADNPDQLLLSRSKSLVAAQTGETDGSRLDIDRAISVLLSDYDARIDEFTARTGQSADYELLVRMPVVVTADLPEGPYTINDELSLKIPLSQPSFLITSSVPEDSRWPLWHLAGFRLVLAEIPFAVFPAMATAALLLLILLLITTCSRPKIKLKHQLKRMLRMARSQLMIIGDKAWEPEWCIAAADYRSMVRTAKKLKHPIFCYIDRQAPSLAAYFYVYYGENNYCYAFNAQSGDQADDGIVTEAEDELPDLPATAVSPASAAEAMPDEQIPLLPETDDSPEIFLANLKMSTGYGHPTR